VCAACHKFGGVGNEVGRGTSAALGRPVGGVPLVHILDPNLAVEASVRHYQKNHRGTKRLASTYTGVLTARRARVSRSAAPTAFRKPSFATLPRIASLITGNSAMPEGLEKTLSRKISPWNARPLRAGGEYRQAEGFARKPPRISQVPADVSLTLLSE